MCSETLRCDWDKVWEMPAIEFLNILAYRKDRDAWEKDAMEQWQKNN